MINLPALKLQPKTIPLPELLKTIKKYSGDYSQLEDHVYELWIASSRRTTPPSKRNALRAVIGPSLRHLDLTRGEGNSFKLTGSAEHLLQKFNEGGESIFKKWFGSHLAHKDAKDWIDVLSTLVSHHEELSISEIIQGYTKNNPQLIIEKGKLLKYLRFFEYCGLITIKEHMVKANERQICAAQSETFVEIHNQEFLHALLFAYNKLNNFTRGPFVAIPDLRDDVCSQIGVFPDEFDEILVSLPRETEDIIIEFAQPMNRQEGKGLHIGAIYMYYLAIHQREEVKND
jgi:hypothetical protein